MSRIDRVVLARLGSRIGVTVLLMFGIIALVESLEHLAVRASVEHRRSAPGGCSRSWLSAARWTLSTLPVTLLDRRHYRPARTAGAARTHGDQGVRHLGLAGAEGAAAAGHRHRLILLSFVGDTAIVTTMRSLSLGLPQAVAGRRRNLAGAASGDGLDYVIVADHQHPGGMVLEDVTFFLPDELDGPRSQAPVAELHGWRLAIPEGVRFQPDAPPQRMRRPDAADHNHGRRPRRSRRLTVGTDHFRAFGAAGLRVSDPALRSGVQMRLAQAAGAAADAGRLRCSSPSHLPPVIGGQISMALRCFMELFLALWFMW